MRWLYDQINYRSLGVLVVVGLWVAAVILVSATGCSTLCRGYEDPDRRPGSFEITKRRPNKERKEVVKRRL